MKREAPSFLTLLSLLYDRTASAVLYFLHFLERMTILNPLCDREMELASQTIAGCYYSMPCRLSFFYSIATFFPSLAAKQHMAYGITVLVIKKGLKERFTPALHSISSKYRQLRSRLYSKRYEVP